MTSGSLLSMSVSVLSPFNYDPGIPEIIKSYGHMHLHSPLYKNAPSSCSNMIEVGLLPECLQ